MSLGTNHMFSQLTKTSKAIDGQRLVRLIAKGKEKSPNLSESLCVSVPVVTAEQVAESIESLIPAVVGFVMDTQDKIIREYRIESGHSSINDEQFNIAACVKWLAENATGERLTSAMLREWFTEDYHDATIQWLQSRAANAGATAEVLERKFNAIKDMMVRFADPRARFEKPQLQAIIAFSDDVECDMRLSAIRAKCVKQLEDIERMETDAESAFE